MKQEITRNSDGTVLVETFENDNLKAVCFAGSVTIEFKPNCDKKVREIYKLLMDRINLEEFVND